MQLLENRAGELRDRYGITFRFTGIASRRLGWIANPEGIQGRGPALGEVQGALARALPRPDPKINSVRDWLSAAGAHVLFEATSLNVEAGQPAVDHISAALAHGVHVITANKGPIVHAYRALRDLAAAHGRRFLFESTVMDGVPIFSFFDQLPAVHLEGFHGILNSTTNVILSGMEQGLSFDEALSQAQQLGIAETDATHDIDGWDAAVKTAALITVLMDAPIRLDQIAREGIRGVTPSAARNARRDGWPFKLVCRAHRTAHGVEASVRPEKVRSSEPMARITGASSYLYFETDIFPGLAVTEESPGLNATAYGLVADFVRAVK